MASTMSESLRVIEECRVSAPPHTVGERSLTLTFFDLLWLLVIPVHQLFFYEYPHSKHHFIQTVIPSLKHSLSLTLQHFFPFASHLIVFSSPQHSNTTTRKPEIRHVEGDSVELTFVECNNNLDFNDLKGDHPRECDKFYGLIPMLANGEKVSDSMRIPLCSVQVTLFPNKGGIAIGVTNHHILCDASSKFDFLRAWTSIAKCGTDESVLASQVLPFYDRVIKYPDCLDEIFLNQPGIENLSIEYKYAQPKRRADKVRATVVLTRTQMDQLKRWVSTQLPTLEYVSSFSVACAHVWSCVAKSRTACQGEDDQLEMFSFSVDWRSRLNPSIPPTYFGNCVGPHFATAKSTLLSKTSGFLTAVELLGNALSEIVNSKDGVIKDAQTWSAKYSKGIPTIWVSGTPKLNVYDLDFGWGRPAKYEVISIDYSGAISINVSKESSQDIEIGLCLPTKQMQAFISIFENELDKILSEQAKNE